MSKFLILNNSPTRLPEYRNKVVEFKTVNDKNYIKIHGIDKRFKRTDLTWDDLLSNGRELTKLDKVLR